MKKIQVGVFSDTICPWCYIGKRNLEEALRQSPEVAADIDWYPFQLNPSMPAEGTDLSDYLESRFSGGSSAFDQMKQRLRSMGKPAGIDFLFSEKGRVPNTLDSHRLMRWAASEGRAHQLAEILFRRNFKDGEDLGDREVLIAAAEEVGMDQVRVRARLTTDEDRDSIEQQDEAARRAGVSSVPTFVFDNKLAVVGAQPVEAFQAVFRQLVDGNVDEKLVAKE
jgi:predicted DsbA family dithiol-disulfide isomerase